MDPERLPLGLRTGPFVESVRRDNAATLQKRFAKRRPLLKRLGLGIDTLASAAIVPGRPIHQTPAGALRLPALELGSNDETLISRRDIKARSVIGEIITGIFHAQRVGNLPPLIPSQGEPSAHSPTPRSPLRAAPGSRPCLRAAR